MAFSEGSRAGACASQQRAHIRARRPGARVRHKAWWSESANVPSGAGGQVARCPLAPCPLRTYVEIGADSPKEPCYAIDDGEIGSGVQPASSAAPGGGLLVR